MREAVRNASTRPDEKIAVPELEGAGAAGCGMGCEDE